MVDPDGRFPVEIHAEICSEIKGWSTKTEEYLIHSWYDGPLFISQKIHFDNYENFSSINEVIENAAGFTNLNDHSIGDFYAHTNYVDLWYNNKFNGIMPLYDELDSNPQFKEIVEKDLMATRWIERNY